MPSAVRPGLLLLPFLAGFLSYTATGLLTDRPDLVALTLAGVSGST